MVVGIFTALILASLTNACSSPQSPAPLTSVSTEVTQAEATDAASPAEPPAPVPDVSASELGFATSEYVFPNDPVLNCSLIEIAQIDVTVGRLLRNTGSTDTANLAGPGWEFCSMSSDDNRDGTLQSLEGTIRVTITPETGDLASIVRNPESFTQDQPWYFCAGERLPGTVLDGWADAGVCLNENGGVYEVAHLMVAETSDGSVFAFTCTVASSVGLLTGNTEGADQACNSIMWQFFT